MEVLIEDLYTFILINSIIFMILYVILSFKIDEIKEKQQSNMDIIMSKLHNIERESKYSNDEELGISDEFKNIIMSKLHNIERESKYSNDEELGLSDEFRANLNR